MHDQRQQGLQPHVAQRWHGIARVRHALDVEAVEALPAAAVLDHGNGAAMALVVEHQGLAARARHEPRQMILRQGPADDERGDAERAGQRRGHGGDRAAAPGGRHAHGARGRGKQRQAADRAQPGQQHEGDQRGAGDAAQGVGRQGQARATAAALARGDDLQHRRKGRAQQQGGQQHHRAGGDGEARAHSGQAIVENPAHAGFGQILGRHQPQAQQRGFGQGDQARARDQRREHAPRIAEPVAPAGIACRAQRQPGQVDRQHHRKGESPRAHEGDDHLRPQHLVTQRHGASHRIQRHGQPGLRRQARRLAGGGAVDRRGRRPAAQRPRAAGGRQVQRGGGQSAALHAEGGNQQEGRQQRAGDGAGGVGGVQGAAIMAAAAGADRAHQDGQGAAHEKRRQRDHREQDGPGQQRLLRLPAGEQAGAVRQQEGNRQRGQADRQFDGGIQAPGVGVPLRQPAQPPAARRQPQEKGADGRGDGVDFDPDDQGKLLDPQDLEYQ